MSKCDPFVVEVTGDLQQTLDRGRDEIRKAGGTFTGDAAGGSFSGKVPMMGEVEGTYTVSGKAVTVTITKKPMFVPCSMIETQVRRSFGG